MKIKNSTIESTPFVQINIKGKKAAWIKLYWTQNSGMFGHQVCAEYNFGDWSKNYSQLKTSGCGYSKEAQALQEIFTAILGERPYSCHYEAHNCLHEFHKGGNYYEVPSLLALKKAFKGLK